MGAQYPGPSRTPNANWSVAPFTAGQTASPANPQPPTLSTLRTHWQFTKRAREVARSGDVFAWRNLFSTCRDQLGPKLSNWLTKYLNQMPTGEQLVPQSMEGIELYAPLIAIGLGGLASMTPQYKDQSAVF